MQCICPARALTDSFAVVPSAEVHPLPDQLDGRLRSVHFERRHVEVVDEEDKKFAERRTEHAFATATQRRNNNII